MSRLQNSHHRHHCAKRDLTAVDMAEDGICECLQSDAHMSLNSVINW